MPFVLRLALAAVLVILQVAPAIAQNESFLETDAGMIGEPAPVQAPEAPDPVKVFIDPGHGGRDLGARGARMELEKTVALTIAKLVRARLSADERLEVTISRPEDMDMPVVDRINMANFMRASVYIGIHIDGGATPQTHPMKVYITKAKAQDSATLPAEEGAAWGSLNKNYSDKNLDLAKAMVAELKGLNAERGVDIVRTDKLFLGGLNMPAVIVEPVDLSNPEDEMRMDGNDFFNKVADALSMAVVDYLMKTGKL